jgi:hypothetical protein
MMNQPADAVCPVNNKRIICARLTHFDVLAAKTGIRYQQLPDNPVGYTPGIERILQKVGSL